MSFGPLFTLRPRARRARPGAADEAWPTVAGYDERRARAPAEPAPEAPRRRASDRPARDPGPK